MYAPKFQSWLSDSERFSMVLDALIDPMIVQAREECRAMIEAASKDLELDAEPPKEKEYYEQINTTIDYFANPSYLNQMVALQNMCYRGPLHGRAFYYGNSIFNNAIGAYMC